MKAATAVPGLVQRLVAHEAEQSQIQQDDRGAVEAVRRACEKLRAHLSTRIGRDGYRTLLARALKLAAAEHPRLNTVRVAPDGTLEGLTTGGGGSGTRPGNQDEPDGTDQGAAAAILTHLLELLVTFVGEALTWRILSTVWPQMDGPELRQGESIGTQAADVDTGTDNKGHTYGREENIV